MEIDLIFKIAAIGIIVTILHQVLARSGRDEQAMMTMLAGLVVVLMMMAQKIADLAQLREEKLQQETELNACISGLRTSLEEANSDGSQNEKELADATAICDNLRTELDEMKKTMSYMERLHKEQQLLDLIEELVMMNVIYQI